MIKNFVGEGKSMFPNPPPLQIRPDSSNPFMLDALIDKKRNDFNRISDSPKNSMESTIKKEMDSQRKESSSASMAHLEYLRALTKHYQQNQSLQNQPQPTTNNLASYQDLLLQQKQNQFLQLNQRRSMEDVLKKLVTSGGRDGIDVKGNKPYDFEHLG